MTYTLDTIAKLESQARALLAEGFTTKVSQKEAREYATRAYEAVRKAIMDACLAVKPMGDAVDAVYWGMPDYPHLWKAKHAALVRTNLPRAAEWIEHADRLAALTAEIKAAPLNLKPRNEDGTIKRIPHISETYNPALRDQFMAQAPALAAEFEASIRARFAYLAEKFGGTLPLYPFEGGGPATTVSERESRDRTQKVIYGMAKFCTRVGKDRGTLVIDGKVLTEEAKNYGERVAMQWFYKTNLKLGELQAATLHEDNGGYVVVSGEKDGRVVVMKQQRIIKVAPKSGEYFHQFPALLYIDGKFSTAYDYSVMFKTEVVED